MRADSDLMEAVARFMARVGAQVPQRLPKSEVRAVGAEVWDSSREVMSVSSDLKNAYRLSGDVRALRGELMTEELAEVLRAMAIGDERELLDGLADLLYVVVGTAVAFDLPLVEAFWEVHRSNMTKGSAAADHQGDRGKGLAFSPPDLARILHEHRQAAAARLAAAADPLTGIAEKLGGGKP